MPRKPGGAQGNKAPVQPAVSKKASPQKASISAKNKVAPVKNKKRKKTDGAFSLKKFNKKNRSANESRGNPLNFLTAPTTEDYRSTFRVVIDELRVGHAKLSPRKTNRYVRHALKKDLPLSYGEISKLQTDGSLLMFSPSKKKGSKRIHVLQPAISTGSMIVYDNIDRVRYERMTSLHVQVSEKLKDVDKYIDELKYQEACITADSLKKVREEDKETGGIRQPTQRQVMTASAQDYVNATELVRTGIKAEWLHLIAKRLLLMKYAQCQENFIAASYGANRIMGALIENDIPFLVANYPQGVTLKISAHMVKDADSNKKKPEYLPIGTTMDFEITTDDGLRILHVIDLQDDVMPTRDMQKYFHSMHSALVNMSKNIETVPDENEPVDVVAHCGLANNPTL